MRTFQLGILAQVLFILYTNSEETCTLQCQELDGIRNLQYRDGVTYTYSFQSKIQISVPNSNKGDSYTRLKASALVTPRKDCSFTLQVENLEIKGDNSHAYRNLKHVEKPITFQYQNGVIGGDLCTDSEDSIVSLNIKRAMVSLLQVDSKNQEQTDIFGTCPTISSYEIHDGHTIVRKSRDLNKCKNSRQNFLVNAMRSLQPSTILTSNYKSEQLIQDGIVLSASVTENYVYFASVSRDDGITVKVTTALEFNGISNKNIPISKLNRIQSVLFEDPEPTTSTKSTIQVIMNTLKALTVTDLAVGESSGRDFLNLVKIIRNSNKDNLITVYRYIKVEQTNIRNIYIQALMQSGSSNALEFVFDLAQTNQISDSEKKIVYLGLINVKYVSRNILHMVSKLLHNKELPQEAYVQVGSLVRRYCDQNSCDDGVINVIMTSFTRQLNTLKESAGEDIVYTLKAIANAKYLNEDISSRVLAVAENTQISTRIRAMALSTLLVDACRNVNRKGLLYILRNVQEDSEIRIKAYLVLAQCPTQAIAKDIEQIINTEPTYQVGSFITTHLKSSSGFLKQIHVNTRFPDDPRKYSFNAQFPYRFNDAGVNTKSTANVIYSQNSFVPRSTSLNITSDLFGSGTNIIQIEIRQQNLDKLTEHYFGPRGVAKREQVELDASPWPIKRKRDVSRYEIEKFTREMPVNSSNNLKVDIDFKLFDSESMYFSVDNDDLNVNNFASFVHDNLHPRITTPRNKKINSILIDSELNYPTSTGFPLRLMVEAVSSLQMMKETSYKQVEHNYKWKWRIIPSANVDLITSLVFDTSLVEYGVQVETKLYAAAGVDVYADSTHPKDSIKLLFPLQEQKLSVSHNIAFKVREAGEQDVLKSIHFIGNHKTRWCPQPLIEYTGVHVCTEMTAPQATRNAYLSGNYKMSFSLNNSDFSHIELSCNSTKNHLYESLELAAKIVSKKRTVKSGVLLKLVQGETSLAKASIILPRYNGSVQIQYINKNLEKSAGFEIQSNAKKFFGKIGLGLQVEPYKYTYSPYLYFSVPGHYGQHFPIKTQGSLTAKKENNNLKLTFENLQLIIQPNEMHKPNIYSINGAFGNKKKNYYSDLILSNGDITIKQHGKFSIAVDGRTKIIGDIKNNYNPDLNLHVDYELAFKDRYMDNQLKVVHGNDLKSKYNRLTIKNYISSQSLENIIKYPPAKFSIESNYTSINGLYGFLEIKLDRIMYGKKFNLTYSKEGGYDLLAKAYDDRNLIELKGKRAIYGELSTVNHTLSINRRFYEASGQIQISRERDSFINLLLKAPELHSPISFMFRKNAYRPISVEITLKDNKNTYINVLSTIVSDRINLKLQLKIPCPRDMMNIDFHFNHVRYAGNGDLSIRYYNVSTKTALNYLLSSNSVNINAECYPDLIYSPQLSYGVTSNTQMTYDLIETENAFEISKSRYLELNAKIVRKWWLAPLVDIVDITIRKENEVLCLFKYSVDWKQTAISDDNMHYVVLKIDVDIFRLNLGRKLKYREGSVMTSVFTNNRYTGTVNGNLSYTQKEDENRDFHRNLKFDVYKDKEYDGLRVVINTSEGNNTSYAFNVISPSERHSIYMNVSYNLRNNPNYLNMITKINSTSMPCYENLNVNFSNFMYTNRQFPMKTILQVTTDDKSHMCPSKKFKLQADFKNEFTNGVITIIPWNSDFTTSIQMDYTIYTKRDLLKFVVNCISYHTDGSQVPSTALFEVNADKMFVNLNAPYPEYPVLLNMNMHKQENTYLGFAVLSLKGDEYKLQTDLNILSTSQRINIELTYPDDMTPDQILIHLLQDRNMLINKMIVKLSNLITLDGAANIYLLDQPEVDILIGLDFPCMRLYNSKLKIENKQLNVIQSARHYAAGNEFSYLVSNAGKNIMSGRFVYSFILRNNAVIYETSINFIKNTEYGLNVKFENDKHLKELSLEGKRNSTILNTKFFISNKDIRLDCKFYDTKNIFFEIQTFHKEYPIYGLHSEEFLYLDLNYVHQYSLNASEIIMITSKGSNISGHIICDNKLKYGHQIVINETFANLSIYTPYLVMALDGNIVLTRRQPERIQFNFYGTKNRQLVYKTTLNGLFDTFYDGYNFINKYEFKLTDRNLPRDLFLLYTINFNNTNVEQNVIIDIFKEERDKLELTQKLYKGSNARINYYEVKSEGMDFAVGYKEIAAKTSTPIPTLHYNYTATVRIGDTKYSNEVVSKFSRTQLAVGVTMLNNKLFYISGENTGSALVSKIDLIGINPVTTRLECRSANLVNFTVILKDPSDVVQVTLKILHQGDIVHLKSERKINDVNILFANISLFVKNDKLLYNYKYNGHSIEQYVIIPLEEAMKMSAFQFRKVIDKAKKEDKYNHAVIKRRMTDNLVDCSKMINAYNDHLMQINDEVFHERAIRYSSMYIADVVAPVVYGTEIVIQKFFALAHYTKDISAKMDRESYYAVRTAFDSNAMSLFNLPRKMNRFIQAHENDIHKYATLFVLFVEDGIKSVQMLKENILQLYLGFENSALYQRLTDGPAAPELFIQNYRRLISTLKKSTHSPIAQRFIDVIANYTEKKLRRESVTDTEEIRKISKAFDELISLTYNSKEDTEVFEVFDTIYRLGVIETDSFGFLITHNRMNQVRTVVTEELNKMSFPVKFNGVIAEKHIFTFDGKHVSFQGDCDYLMVHDSIDGNFSVLASYKANLLDSITYVDKHEKLTVWRDKIMLNEQHVEMPLHVRELEVFYDYEEIHVLSRRGIQISCDLALTVCSVQISGYYHAHVRGLLGNGNYEPYDDFTLPSGKIASNGNEFVNSYKVNAHCSAHAVQRNVMDSQCHKLFIDFNLRHCKNYVNTTEYESACDEGTQMGVSNIKEKVARAYVKNCNFIGATVNIPDSLVKCKDYEKNVNETFQVELPGRSADIVLVIDSSNYHSYSEQLGRLVHRLKSHLNANQINDIMFHPIAYAVSKYPQHYSGPGNLYYKMETDRMLGHSTSDMLNAAYKEALMYPFRAHALKSIIIFTPNECGSLSNIQSELPYLMDHQIQIDLFTKYTYTQMPWEYYKLHKKSPCFAYVKQQNGDIFNTPHNDNMVYSAGRIVSKLTKMRTSLYCKCKMISAYRAQNVCEQM